MSSIADFGVTHDVAVTLLVDNRADLLVKSTKAVRYFTDASLLAEHGFAALIHLKGAGIRILWDAGISCIEDDQAIVINVQDKGLVIVSGCAHSGIVNTVNHGREISGVDRVWGVLGGFHLAPATEEEISKTIAAIKAHAPRLVAPTHCTGFHAISRFAAEMPEAFVQGVVGATYFF
jgi:metal-dependent hydrolase (beta-lactamase superfamily II)